MAIAIEEKQQLAGFKSPFLIRLLDLTVAILGLLLLWPLFVIISGIIKLTSPGPVFYRARRMGQGQRHFKLYKFRSMVQDADQQGPGITVNNDARITRIGRLLRRTKLDELPQLINILRGEMSLVGPRPEDPRYLPFYTPEQRQILSVRPGITSPASIYYHNEETLLSGDQWESVYRKQILPNKLALDLAYLRQRTVRTDIILILKTIVTVLHGWKIMDLLLTIRNRHFFVLDFFILLLTPGLAVSLRLDGWNWWPRFVPALLLYTAVALVLKMGIFYSVGLYRRYWRYASVDDLMSILVAAGLSTLFLTALFIAQHDTLAQHGLAMYRTVPLIDGLLTLFVAGGARLGIRGIHHWHKRQRRAVGGRRVLVVGAGETGTMVVREMRANPQLNMEPVAFVDDNPAKIGSRIRGLPVLGTCRDIPNLVEKYRIQRIVVAIPSAPLGRQQEIVALCEQTGVLTHSLPGMYQILAGHKTITRLPQYDIPHLLNRSPVEIDPTEVGAQLRGKTVLITGAGGSIGSELCRQIARMDPKMLILLGHGENSIFEINLDLHLSFPHLTTQPLIVDVRDRQRINRIVGRYKPQVIFHAAAHKHVPFMEANVAEAVTTNIQGTQNVLRAAEEHGVAQLVLISTDKAVNPTSIMGATKRMAELLVVAAAQRSNQAYIAVRFGNVLGSRGSVIPVFQRQIAAGGPLTVTHPEMSRYFMTIPEAVQLVLQATVLGQGGEVFVLDMGEPVKILDLAMNMVRLAGLEPERDIKIVYTGIRPGEKLHEELFLTGEHYRRTRHHKIFKAKNQRSVEVEALEQVVIELVELSQQMQNYTTNEQLRVLLPKICYYLDKYQPQAQLPAAAPQPCKQSGPADPIQPQTTSAQA